MNGLRIWAIEWVKKALLEVQEYVRLCVAAAQGAVSRPFYFRDVIEQIDVIGLGSLTVVLRSVPSRQPTLQRSRPEEQATTCRAISLHWMGT